MRKHFIKLATIIPACLLIFSSCKTNQVYRESVIRNDSLFRGETGSDSLTIATIPYSQMFRDSALQTLLSEGIKNNNDLKVAVQRIRQAAANFRQSKAAFLPDFSAGPQFTQQKVAAVQGGNLGFTPAQVYEVSGTASWELDVWGKLKAAKKSALASLLESDAYRRSVQTQLVSDIATDYYNLLAYDEQLKITRETVENRKADVHTNRALKEGSINNANEAAVAQSEANRYAAEVTIPDLEYDIRQTENALSLLLGRPSGTIIRDSLNAEKTDSILPTGVPARLLANRPDVQEAEFVVRRYFEQINIARAYFYPSLNITAQGGWQSATLKGIFSTGSLFRSVAAGLTEPFLNKGLNKQRLELARSQYQENVINFQQKVLVAGQEVSNALYSYQAAKNKIAVRTEQLNASQRAVNYNRQLLLKGYATYTDVLTSEQNYLSAQLNGVSDRLQQLTAVVNLYRSLGGGWR